MKSVRKAFPRSAARVAFITWGALLFGCISVSSAQAALVCSIFGGTILDAGPSGTCAEAATTIFDGITGSQGNPIPFDYGFSPASGTVAVLGAGTDLDASASVTADIGALHLLAKSSDSNSNLESFASAHAIGAFADTGTVELPGALAGTPLHAIVTVAIDGFHTLNAGFFDGPHLNVGNFINIDSAFGSYSFDTFVGAVLPLSLGIEIFADSSVVSPVNFADYSNTAHLFFDFTETGAFFSADSGHNYSSAAVTPIATPIPVPATLSLFASGLVGLALLGRRKKTKLAGA